MSGFRDLPEMYGELAAVLSCLALRISFACAFRPEDFVKGQFSCSRHPDLSCLKGLFICLVDLPCLGLLSGGSGKGQFSY